MAAIALPSTMHAWQYKEYGKGMHQVELPVPAPGPKELLVKVAATSLNPLDYKLESGSLKMIYGLKLPITPCTDVAGTVAAVGEGVTDFAVGDRVAAWSDVMKSGGLAEYVLLDKKSAAAKLPASVSFEEASGVVTTGMTALQALRDKAGVPLSGYKGRVLIMAASGGVGIYAVQLAKKAGAHVTVTVGARNADLARSLGADDVIDYRAVADPDNPLAHPGGELYDVILHTTAVPEKWDHFHRVLTPKGCVVSTIPEFSTFLRTAIQSVTFAGQKMIPIFCDCSKAEDLKLLIEMMGRGELKTVVDSKTPLKEADKAWERCLGGHATGKIVVTVP